MNLVKKFRHRGIVSRVLFQKRVQNFESVSSLWHTSNRLRNSLSSPPRTQSRKAHWVWCKLHSGRLRISLSCNQERKRHTNSIFRWLLGWGGGSPNRWASGQTFMWCVRNRQNINISIRVHGREDRWAAWPRHCWCAKWLCACSGPYAVSQARKKSTKIGLLVPETAGWGGVSLIPLSLLFWDFLAFSLLRFSFLFGQGNPQKLWKKSKKAPPKSKENSKRKKGRKSKKARKGGSGLEGVMVEKFVPSLESLSSLDLEGMNSGCPGNFAGMSRTPRSVQKVCAQKPVVHLICGR